MEEARESSLTVLLLVYNQCAAQHIEAHGGKKRERKKETEQALMNFSLSLRVDIIQMSWTNSGWHLQFI